MKVLEFLNLFNKPMMEWTIIDSIKLIIILFFLIILCYFILQILSIIILCFNSIRKQWKEEKNNENNIK